MHKKKKEHKNAELDGQYCGFFRGLQDFGSGFGCLYWVSFASYHRIEDNLELEVETGRGECG